MPSSPSPSLSFVVFAHIVFRSNTQTLVSFIFYIFVCARRRSCESACYFAFCFFIIESLTQFVLFITDKWTGFLKSVRRATLHVILIKMYRKKHPLREIR